MVRPRFVILSMFSFKSKYLPLCSIYSPLTGLLLLAPLVRFASIQVSRPVANYPIAGIGGGGIVSAVWVITAEIVDVRQHAVWSQALSITWSCSAIAGPIIGGLFSGMIPFISVPFMATSKPQSLCCGLRRPNTHADQRHSVHVSTTCKI